MTNEAFKRCVFHQVFKRAIRRITRVVQIFSRRVRRNFNRCGVVPVLRVVNVRRQDALASHSTVQFKGNVMGLGRQLEARIFSPCDKMFFIYRRFVGPSIVRRFFNRYRYLLVVVRVGVRTQGRYFSAPCVRVAVLLIDERNQGVRHPHRVICRLLVTLNCNITNELVDERYHFGLSECSREDAIIRYVKRDGRTNGVRRDRSTRNGHLNFSAIRNDSVVHHRCAKFSSFRRAVYLIGRTMELVPCPHSIRNVVYHGIGFVMEQCALSNSFTSAYLGVFTAAVNVVRMVVTVMAIQDDGAVSAIRNCLYLFRYASDLQDDREDEQVRIRPITKAKEAGGQYNDGCVCRYAFRVSRCCGVGRWGRGIVSAPGLGMHVTKTSRGASPLANASKSCYFRLTRIDELLPRG